MDRDSRPADLFSAIRQGDILLHHPYQSFMASTQQFIEFAARDPQVLAIKQTLYRTSNDSPVVTALIQAAERGKQVAVLVEVKARFDEERNIEWARKLEDAGCHVAYGLVGLKTHSKISLVVREEEDSVRTYFHIGTGNYNPKTATLYTDLGLISCQPDIGADILDLFNYLTGYSRQTSYRKLLVAPVAMRTRFMEMINGEIAHANAGRPARIIAKMNTLDDPAIVQRLYEASQAGVKIDLIVRGNCRLRPGIPGVSENIRVVSVIGRFLEHCVSSTLRTTVRRSTTSAAPTGCAAISATVLRRPCRSKIRAFTNSSSTFSRCHWQISGRVGRCSRTCRIAGAFPRIPPAPSPSARISR